MICSRQFQVDWEFLIQQSVAPLLIEHECIPPHAKVDKTINYSEPELMRDSPVLRFKVQGEPHDSPLELSSASGSATPSAFLTASDLQIAKDDPAAQSVATLGSRGELLASRVATTWVPVRAEMVWIDVKPADLLSHLDLLDRNGDQIEKGAPSEQELADFRKIKQPSSPR